MGGYNLIANAVVIVKQNTQIIQTQILFNLNKFFAGFYLTFTDLGIYLH